MNCQMPRGFKGIWIPKEVWFNKNLSLFEKCLWAEINSLDHEDRGCIASNEYLCNFFGVQEKTLQRGLAKLKGLGYVKVEKFDGRIRIMRADIKDIFVTSAPTSPTIKDIFVTPQASNLSPLDDSVYIQESKEENKDKEIYKEIAPQAGPRPSAPVCVFESFGSFVKLKRSDYDEFVSKHGKPQVDEMIESMNDYLASTGTTYKDYAAALRNWFRRKASSPTPNSARPPSVASEKDNKEFAEKVKSLCADSKIVTVQVGHNYLEMYSGATSYLSLKFSDHGFEDRALNWLRQRSIDVRLLL